MNTQRRQTNHSTRNNATQRAHTAHNTARAINLIVLRNVRHSNILVIIFGRIFARTTLTVQHSPYNTHRATLTGDAEAGTASASRGCGGQH